MMLKEKSNPWARLKYLYVLPLAAIAVTAFARPEISEKVEEISAVKVNDLAEIVQENVLRDTENMLQDTVKVSHSDSKAKVRAENRAAKTKGNEELVVFEVVEQMPEYPGGMNALYKYLENKTKSSDVKGKAGGSVIVGFTVSESGKVKDVRALQSDQPILTKEAERIVSEMPAWTPGKQRGMPVSVKYSVPVRFGDIRFPENKKPLIMVDGKEMSMETFEKIDRGIIESFSVLKDSASIGLYGKRGANGVILVTTRREGKTRVQDISTFTEIKATETNTVPDFLVAGIVTDEQGQPKAGVSIVVPSTTIGAITDANGRFRLKTPKDSYLWFSFIGYKTVKAAVASEMSIRMEQDVVKLFPETSVSLKTTGTLSSGTKVGNSLILHGVEEGKQPLIIINDKEVSDKEALSKIAPDRIKSFSILKDASATAVYGVRGANGVVLVTTKRGTADKLQITGRANLTISHMVNMPEYLGAYEYAKLANEALAVRGNPIAYSDMALDLIKYQLDPDLYPDVNWQDEVLNRNALQQTYYVNAKGGGSLARYYLSLGMSNESSAYKQEKSSKYSTAVGYRTYNYRVNLDINLTKTTTVYFGSDGFLSEKSEPGNANTDNLHYPELNSADYSKSLFNRAIASLWSR